jgi:hypothetical protein
MTNISVCPTRIIAVWSGSTFQIVDDGAETPELWPKVS